jgi:hypothetical protein
VNCLISGTAETELQDCDETAVFESSLINDINEGRNGSPLDRGIAEPGEHPECPRRAEWEGFQNELGEKSGSVHSIESGYIRVPDRQYRRELK